MIKILPRFNKEGFYILGILGIFILISTVYFYWYAWRPAKIKHDCSWVRQYEPPKAAEPAMTEEQLRENGMLKDCLESSNPKTRKFFEGLTEWCHSENRKTIEEYKDGKAAVPAKEWWEPADEDQYRFCLHDKGL